MEPRSSKPNTRPTVRRPQADTDPAARVKDLPLSASDAFLGPPQKADEVGRLGPYRVLGVLGRGGMGTVYRAEDPRLKRQVAVKVLLPEMSADPRAKARFRREAQAQAKVDHDNIIPIYEVDEANGVVYLAMPLLKGQTLASALKQNRRPPVSELVRVGREIAEGLAAAHTVGLIHRDIKPGNIWLEGSRRRVKILDFGLARNAGPTTGNSGDPLTAAGAIMGTPSYMSPEQARSSAADQRSDIFSLGVLLYEMATGRKPFTGGSAFDVMAAVVSFEQPPVTDLVPELPEELSELVQRMLAKDPDDRPQNCEAVAEELEALGRGLTVLPVQVIPLGSVPGDPDPWADIDTTYAQAIVTVHHAREEQPTRPRATAPSPKWLWPAVGAFGAIALVALVVLGVSAMRPKKNQEAVEEPKPPITTPKASAATAKKDEQKQAVVAKKEEPLDPRAAAVDKILARGGTLRIPGKRITRATDLAPNDARFESVVLASGPYLTTNDPAADWDAGKVGNVDAPFTGGELSVLSELGRDIDHLYLAGQRLTNPDVAELVKLANVANVKTLHVTNCDVSDDAVRAIAELLEVRKLVLNNNINITDAGVKYLPGKLPKLTSLRLQQTGITDSAVPDLARLTALESLDLKGTKVSDARARDLADALPDCWIRYSNGKVIQPTKKGDPPAKASAGLVFDGKSTFVKVPKLNFDGTLPLTIEAWLTPETVGDKDRHICLLGEPGGGLGLSKVGAVGVGVFDGTKWHEDFSRVNLKAKEKVHVAAVVSQNRILLFIDGKQVGTKEVALGALPPTEGPAVIGKGTKFAGGAGYFHGTMHGLRVSNSARYTAKDFKPPATLEPDAATVALYRFDEGKGKTLTDYSKNKYHGEIESGTWAEPKVK